MFNSDFLKKLTVLFVEDEKLAREQFGKSLKRLFKNVIFAENGEDGYYKFQEARLKSEPIDLILSDINMPKMNGIEMLEKIRELDENIPVMYLTARTEIEYLQKAIELNVNHYALKPINLEDTISRIQKVCEKQYYQMIIDSKNNELKSYLNVINSVAAIFKIDNDGKIEFINDLFCELLEESSESLIGKNFTSLFHNETTNKLEDDIWSKIRNDQIWTGNIKFQNKSNEAFFIKCSFFKIVTESGFDYINIGFVSTDDVQKQREFHKNVLLTISDKSKKNTKYKTEIDSISKQNQQLKEMNELLNKEMKHYKDRINHANNQIEFYEKKILSMDKTLENRIRSRNNEKNNLEETLNKAKRENELISDQNEKLKDIHNNELKEIDRLKDLVTQKEKRIESLSEVLEHRESQIRKLNPDLLL